MLKRVRSRLTYANVTATLAIFIALGGGAYAVSLDRNQVKSKHLAMNTAKAKDIATGGVRSAEVADGAIGTSEIGDGSIAAEKIAAGAVGSEAVADGSIGAAEIEDGQVGVAETATELGFRCPGGTRYHEGACIETSPRTADDWNSANGDCINENRRLPSFAELQTFRNAPGITLTEEWTGGFWTDGGAFALTVTANGGLTARTAATDMSYRCAATPNS